MQLIDLDAAMRQGENLSADPDDLAGGCRARSVAV